MGRPVVTFEAGWSDLFFCSLAWAPAWFRQESSVQRRGAGTSARPNSHLTSVGCSSKTSRPRCPSPGWAPYQRQWSVLRRKKLEKKFDEIQNKVRARKEGATDDDVIELLGSNVDGPSYDNYECGDVGANTRCYAQVHLLPCCNSHGMVPTNCSFSDAKGARRGLRLLWQVL